MAASVSDDRWRAALAAEDAYWGGFRADAKEFMRVLREKVEMASWVSGIRPAMPAGAWVEVGIGPYGLGCLHFLPTANDQTLVGVEPLSALSARDLELPPPLGAVVECCHAMNYVQIQATGEDTGLAASRFAVACCYNVLDQVRDATLVLRELHRIVEPSATLLLGCNVASRASILRHRLRGERYARSLGLTAHTLRFEPATILRLVREAGFTVDATFLPDRGLRMRLAGRAQRLLVVATKAAV